LTPILLKLVHARGSEADGEFYLGRGETALGDIS
jgi:hypothetical protein